MVFDSDNLAIHIEQRAAAVARVDGRVGLDEVLEAVAGVFAVRNIARKRADDAGGGLSPGSQNGEPMARSPVSDLEGVGITDLRGDQVFLVNMDYREICIGVGSDHGCRIVGRVVGELDLDARSLVHDVVCW